MDQQPNKTIRPGLPPDARLLHLYAPGDVMKNGERATGKEPNELRGHHDAVHQNNFLDISTNVGIALDGQFLAVDFDVEHALVSSELDRLPETWRQKTLRGQHLLYRVPKGWKGRNSKYVATTPEGRQVVLGDIKALGYIVAPGSLRATDDPDAPFLYHRLGDQAPVDAPDWLLARAARRDDELTITVDGARIERDRIEMGANDAELTALAGFMRHRGMSGSAIATMIAGIIDSGILEQDESRPYTHDDAVRIARSASKWEVGTGDGSLNVCIRPDQWVCAADIPLVEAPTEWWIHGFVPKNNLVMLYGDGGIGKSTWVSMLAATVTKAGGTFVHIGVEEPFRLFAARAVLLGADRSKLLSMPNAAALCIPRDVAGLAEGLEQAKASFVYFDSIYTHFEREEGSNAAERTRAALGALAAMAQEQGVTVLGNFHENKEGKSLGSVEMKNVGRCFLHASRAEGKPLRLKVVKTNLTEPDHYLEYPGIPTVWTDPATGEVQMERLDDGTLVPHMLVLPGPAEKKITGRETATSEQIEPANEARMNKSSERAEQAQQMAEQGMSVAEIARQLGVTPRTVRRLFSGTV